MASPESRTSLHVYNARCALTIEPTRNRRGDIHTVNLESATRTTATGEFAWANKIVVQVTGRELPDVIAVLLGHLPSAEFRYHGAAKDKGYRLFHDGERLIVQLFAGAKDRHTITLAPTDRLSVVTTAFRQLQRNHGGVSADVLHAMLTSIYARRGAPDGTPIEAALTERVDPPRDRTRSAASATPAEPSGSRDVAPAPSDPDAYDW